MGQQLFLNQFVAHRRQINVQTELSWIITHVFVCLSTQKNTLLLKAADSYIVIMTQSSFCH